MPRKSDAHKRGQSAERQRRYKAKQAAAGRTEVRGIYAHPSRHAVIRAAGKRLADEVSERE